VRPNIINVADGNLATLFSTAITLNLPGSADTVTFNDTATTAASVYELYPTYLRRNPGAAQIVFNYSGPELVALRAGSGNDQIICIAGATNLSVFGNAGNDTINAWNGFTTVHTGPEGGNPAAGDVVQVNVDHAGPGDQPATVRFSASDRVSDLRVSVRGTAQAPTGVTVDITNSLALQGVIDMNGGAMLVRNAASSMAVLKNLIKTGRANGAWNGGSTGAGSINSSLAASTTSGAQDAVGYARGSDLFGFGNSGVFAGVTVNANDSLWRYALCGDADLNGVVNFDDYARIDQGFNTLASDWFKGDFDYNNAVNFDDYALIDLAFNTQLSAMAGRGKLDRG
jgi:hypothetical protein